MLAQIDTIMSNNHDHNLFGLMCCSLFFM